MDRVEMSWEKQLKKNVCELNEKIEPEDAVIETM